MSHSSRPLSPSSLLCGLAHDLRQPLATIDTCACYLEMLVPEEEQRIRRHLALIQEEVENAERILAQAVAAAGAAPSQPVSDTAAPVSREFTKAVTAALT